MTAPLSSVFLAVPTRGIVNADCAQTHQRLAADLATTVVYQKGGHSVASNRNMIVKHFLESTCDVLMMVDDDIGVPPHASELPGKLGEEWDVIGAACPIFLPDRWPLPVYAAYRKGQPGKYRLLDDRRKQGIVACDGLGGGCLAIHRRVFDHVSHQPFQETINDDDHVVSEDTQFFLHCNAADLRVAVDFDTVCDHIRAVSLLDVMRGMAEVAKQIRRQQAPRVRLADEFGVVVAP